METQFIFSEARFASCHASTIVETPQGLAAAWFGGTREGNPDVGIWFSQFKGGDWSIPVEIANGEQSDGERASCFNPVLFQAVGGPLLLFYKVGRHPTVWKGRLKHSSDAGENWSVASALPDGYIGPDKNKPVCLPNGTLLCGTSVEDDRWRVRFEVTDVQGKTWSHTPFVRAPDIDAIQPSVLFTGGDILVALGRTRQGWLFRTTSRDFGESWGAMELTKIPNPNSGTDALTLKDGRHLLVYNHSAKRRSPLVVAVLSGKGPWRVVSVLEDEPGEFSYPACIQGSDGMIHITYTWNRLRIRHVEINPREL